MIAGHSAHPSADVVAGLVWFCVLSASKGPVLAWMIATAYILWRGRRLETLSYRALLGALGALMSAGLLSAAAGYSIAPCGTVKNWKKRVTVPRCVSR